MVGSKVFTEVPYQKSHMLRQKGLLDQGDRSMSPIRLVEVALRLDCPWGCAIFSAML